MGLNVGKFSYDYEILESHHSGKEQDVGNLEKDQDGESDSIRTASTWRAVVNMTSFVQGVGTLTLPYAVMKGGVATIIAFILFALVHWYTGKIMVDSIYEEDNEGIKEIKTRKSDRDDSKAQPSGTNEARIRNNYGDLGEVLWPQYGGVLLHALQSLDLLFVAVSYLISCGTLLAHAIPLAGLSEAMWTSIIAIVVLPTTFLKDLACVAWQSLLSIMSSLVMVSVLIWYAVSHPSTTSFKNLLFWDTEGVLVALGLVISNYCIYSILIPVEESMVDRSKFGSALGISMILTAMFRVIFSIAGFLSFAENTDEVIGNNFPLGAARTIVTVMCVMCVVFSYTLVVYPVIQSLDDSKLTAVVTSYIPSFIWLATARFLVVFVTLLVAVLIPHFAILMSFTGSLILPFLEYMVPCLVHLKLKWSGLTPFQIAADGTIVVLGVFATVLGAYFSGRVLIAEMTK